MDVAHLLTDNQPPGHSRRAHPSIEDNHGSYQPWQNNGIDGVQRLEQRPLDLSPQRPGAIGAANSPYSSTLPPKSVAFEYILPEPLQQKARLPMRVNIYPHDATDSIITTVKNFYGLYDGNGVSFEDKEGNTLIARYENFQNRMTVYVRVVDDMGSASATPHVSLSPKRPYLGPPFEMNPPPQVGDHLHSRPSSRAAHHRSASPNNTRGRRSVSVNTNTKSRSRPNIKSRTGSAHGSFADPNGQFAQDMSDSDGGDASVTSSRRGKAEVVASAEISVENIVEGGRRKRARFDSSVSGIFSHLIFVRTLLIFVIIGTPTFCAVAGANANFNLVCLSTATDWLAKCCVSIPVLEPAHLRLHAPLSIPTKSRILGYGTYE